MDNPMDESLPRAYELTYFIHGDKGLAARIVTQALTKLETATAAQDKRLYYTPTGRSLPGESKPPRVRTKVSMSEPHLLQRLLYLESEPYERQQEQATGGAILDEDDMIIRFIKHLVKITVRRNSFHVTLGLSRLLHNYSTAETMNIYNLVVQDPGRVRDGYDYRRCKKRLMKEIQERFGQLVKTVRGQHGEERFQAQDDSRKLTGLVSKCLSLFTPWNTPCVIPDRFDPIRQELPQFSFKGDDPDQEHRIEVKRMHSVIHPDCYSRLTKALKVGPPEQRLEIPQFFLAQGEDETKPPRGDRYHPPELTEEELITIQNELTERAAQRKRVSAGLLSIMVDGIEHARLDLTRASHTVFEVEEGADLIEVRARTPAGDVPLATHLLTYDDSRSDDQPIKTSIVLEGGQKVSLAVSLIRDADGEVVGALVDVGYRETNLIRAASLFWRRLKYRLSESLRLPGWRYAPVRKPALAFALVAACIVGLMFYAQLRKRSPEPPQLAEQQRTLPTVGQERPALPSTPESQSPSPIGDQHKAVSPPTEKPAASSEREQKQRAPATRAERPIESSTPQVAASDASRQLREASPPAPILTAPSRPDSSHAAPPENANVDVEAARGLGTESAAASLLAVKRVYVESLGDDSFSQNLRDILVSGLQTMGRPTVTEHREEADAVLKGSVRQTQTRVDKNSGEELIVRAITLRLVNAKGDVLWRWTTTEESSGGDYWGVAARVVKALLGEIQRLERTRAKPQ